MSTPSYSTTENSKRTPFKVGPLNVLKYFDVEINIKLNKLMTVIRNLKNVDLDACDILVKKGLAKLRAWPAEQDLDLEAFDILALKGLTTLPPLHEDFKLLLIQRTVGNRQYECPEPLDPFQVRMLHSDMYMYFKALVSNKDGPKRILKQSVDNVSRLFRRAKRAIITESQRRNLHEFKPNI